jgi:hypothetical protein
MSYEHLRTLEASFSDLLDPRIRQLNTAIPGVIESYDPGSKTAAVSVPISDFYAGDDGGDIEEPWPVLEDVPVCFPGGGGWQMTWPLQPGDPVLLVFCQRDITRWFATNGKEPHAPLLADTHNESSAICLPRLFPEDSDQLDAAGEHFTIEGHGVKVLFKRNGNAVIEAGRVELGADGAAQALGLASKQDLINTNFAARVDLLITILTGGAFPPMSPVESIASQKVFASA